MNKGWILRIGKFYIRIWKLKKSYQLIIGFGEYQIINLIGRELTCLFNKHNRMACKGKKKKK